jgi:CPA2 family monovalent cation:H+ antiporter-2/glutathione-regulated potassium-efflux system protein KefB
MNEVGLSPALGTFLAGVVLADSEYRHELEAKIEPFKGLLLGVFFISVGASIDFLLVVDQPLTIAGMVVGLMVVKFLVLMVLGTFFRLALDQNLLFAFLLSQAGEFAFVLLSFATRSGVVPQDASNLLVVVVSVSMATTPLLLVLHERLIAPRLAAAPKGPTEQPALAEPAPVVIAGFGRFGQLVGRLLMANGVRVTVLEYDSDQVELLHRLGLQVYYGDASRVDLLRAAGLAEAKLLVVATADAERTQAIVETARRYFPGLKILTRARGRHAAYDLRDLGVDGVYRETLDSSLRLGADALRALGFRAHEAQRAARRLRRHDENSIIELGRLRHDRKGYLSRAREVIKDVEQLIRSEMSERAAPDDTAWDASSRREQAMRDDRKDRD